MSEHPTLSLEPYHIQRPEKVRWRIEVQDGDILNSLKSNSLKTFLSQSEQILSDHHIEVSYHTLNKEEYLDWLKYYEENMTRHGYDIIATEKWYDDRIEQGKTVEGMFFTQLHNQEKRLVASGIFTIDGAEKATFAFKASERLKLTGGDRGTLGAILDYYFMREMLKKSVKIISAGKSRNAFGVYNTLGYLNYSLRFGFIPSPAEDTEFFPSVPLSEDGLVLCYAVKDGQFGLYGFKPEGSNHQFEHKGFATPEIPFFEMTYQPGDIQPPSSQTE
jgi:hypothetical protein